MSVIAGRNQQVMNEVADLVFGDRSFPPLSPRFRKPRPRPVPKVAPMPPNPELLAFLSVIAAAPNDEGNRHALADWLQERGAASPVRLNHLPNWLRLRWLRKRRSVGERGRDRDTTAGWAVANEINRFLDHRLDHWGSTTILGVRAFVDEPYARREEAVGLWRPVAQRLGLVDAYSMTASWNAGCVRGILFECPNQPNT